MACQHLNEIDRPASMQQVQLVRCSQHAVSAVQLQQLQFLQAVQACCSKVASCTVLVADAGAYVRHSDMRACRCRRGSIQSPCTSTGAPSCTTTWLAPFARCVRFIPCLQHTVKLAASDATVATSRETASGKRLILPAFHEAKVTLEPEPSNACQACKRSVICLAWPQAESHSAVRLGSLASVLEQHKVQSPCYRLPAGAGKLHEGKPHFPARHPAV